MTRIEPAPTENAAVSDSAALHAKAIELGKHVLRMTTASGSGHPSSGLAIVHIIAELMYHRMRYDLSDPWSTGNDRLVLSIGHAVPTVYAAYADLGGVVGKGRADARVLTVDDLESLRELDSVLDGHPNPAEGFPFFDAATGSLGQGLSVAAGLALAARLDKIDKRIYCVIGDGEAREGQVWEAMDFIVDHKLSNICAVFSCNGHGQADAVSPQQSSDAIAMKSKAFGWNVIECDGHDPAALSEAFDESGRSKKPTAVVARTVKGWGVASMLGKNYHGKPATGAELEKMIAELDETGVAYGAVAADVGSPTPPAAFGEPKRGAVTLPPFDVGMKRAGLEAQYGTKKLATRVAYGVGMIALGDVDSRIVSVDGDVSNSTFANMFQKEHAARFFEGKIAEQNMVSVASGLAAGGKIPFVSSFAKFLARAVDQIDMAVISRANIKIVGSHAGVSLGADGPSQMSVSDMAYFRSLTRVDNGAGGIGCYVFQPADAVCAYRCCELMANVNGVCFLRTHRPDAAFLYADDETFALRGCKHLRRGDKLTLVSSGYMLHTVLEACDKLGEAGVSCHVFDAYTLPLDAAPILSAAESAGGTILVVEDNYVGGVHAELAEAASVTAATRVVGMNANRIPKSGKTAGEVFDYVGVGLNQIIARAKELVR